MSSTSDNEFLNGTTTVDKLPQQGSSFGALKYNINEKIDWRLGNPTAEEIYLYSDLYFDGGSNSYRDILTDNVLFKQNDATYDDQTLVNVISKVMTYGDMTISKIVLDAKTYETTFSKSDGLFGIAFFKWSPFGLPNSDGNYCLKTYYGTSQYIAVNPMRREVMIIKLFTVLKIFGISVGTVFLIKLLLKLHKK